MDYLVSIAIYIITFLGLYIVARKVDYIIPLFAFIPYLNWYMIISIAWYWKGMFILLLLFSGLFFYSIYFWILFLLLMWFILFNFWMRTVWKVFPTLVLMFLPVIGFYIIWYELIKKQKLEDEKRAKLRMKKKVWCDFCKKTFLVSRRIINIEANCPNCWKKIFIK